MRQTAADHPDLHIRYVIADRGYDAMSNYKYLDDHRILSVIHVRNTDRHSGLYDVHGRPICLGKQPMEYVRTNKGQGHLFRCPEGGCQLKDDPPWLGPCRQEHYETWTGDLSRRVGRLPRAGKRWRRLYRRRTIIERMFSGLERSMLLDGHS